MFLSLFISVKKIECFGLCFGLIAHHVSTFLHTVQFINSGSSAVRVHSLGSNEVLNGIKVVDSCWTFSTELSDTFRSCFVYGKEQES